MKKILGVSMIATLLLVFFSNCSGGGEVVPNSPGNLLKAFKNAVEADDKVKAEPLCTKEYWNEKRDSGKRFFKQAGRKKFELKENEVKVKGDKAVVVTDIIRDGKVVDQVFFYCIKNNDQWLFDGMDENTGHIGYYLDGKLPGRFYPEDYPGDKELEALGAKLAEIAGPLKETVEPAQQEPLIKTSGIESDGTTYSKLRLLREVGQLNLKVTATHMVTPIDRGAIVIHDETGKEKVFIYVAKVAGGWKLINCTTGWLSAESMLR
ncbi:MAG: hypothetical protein GY950_26820 [bacterium]|nr:hypothetical protein [bacterium]